MKFPVAAGYLFSVLFFSTVSSGARAQEVESYPVTEQAAHRDHGPAFPAQARQHSGHGHLQRGHSHFLHLRSHHYRHHHHPHSTRRRHIHHNGYQTHS